MKLIWNIYLLVNETYTQPATSDLMWLSFSFSVNCCCIYFKERHSHQLWMICKPQRYDLNWDTRNVLWKANLAVEEFQWFIPKHRSWGDPPYHLNIMSCFGPFWNGSSLFEQWTTQRWKRRKAQNKRNFLLRILLCLPKGTIHCTRSTFIFCITYDKNAWNGIKQML